MSKNNSVVSDSAADNQPQQPTSESGSPAFVEDLLKNGTTILTAATPEELNDMIDSIPAECRYGAGAVGRNADTGAYTLRIDILKD